MNRLPERIAACRQRALAAIGEIEATLYRIAEQRAEILVHVGLAFQAVEVADVVEVAEEGAEYGGHHRIRDRPPDRVHDHRARFVVVPVVVDIESRGVAADPVVEQRHHLRIAGARGRTRVEHPAHDRPDR